MFKKVNPKQNFPEMEKEILTFWRENNIFEKSVNKAGNEKTYSFFDGPPFATGLPHYGHVVASLMKDVVPRYWTMRGCGVERRWGWDCHGLPIENLVEKEHNIKNKQDIEKWGIDKFNDACHASVLRYADEWKKFIPRIGRWVDMENDYRTMDWKYTESIWWVFSELYKKGLVYEGYKAMHICPRCETTLSNFEVTQGYKEITDLSATVKFRLKAGQKIGDLATDENTFVLAWTTTPWTLPGNVALAVGKDIEYAMVKLLENQKSKIKNQNDKSKLKNGEKEEIGNRKSEIGNDFFVLAKSALERIIGDYDYEIVGNVKGKELVDLEYEPLFDYYSKKEDLENKENGWKIYAGDFVTTEEGTGVVHIAPAFGEDDMNLGKKYSLPFIQHVKMNGRFADEVMDFRDRDGQGMEVKPKRNPRETDEKIVRWLEENNKLFARENYKHSYPHCWRCDTPLLNYATSSWFVKVTEIKDKMIKNNREIRWVPEYIKEGRFGKWLEEARDWAVSRSRFWGAPLPVWRCENKAQSSKLKAQNKIGCGNLTVISSVNELKKKALREIRELDLHKPNIDRIKIKCSKCGGEASIVGDVFDCWFESGSMPYAQWHYPFENQDKFEKGFPAEFIAEGLDQTRGWFYTMIVLSTALFDKPAFRNVIVNGIVLAENGQKMSKRLKNYPEPDLVLQKYGADSLRYYLLTSPVMKAENLRFSEKGVEEILKRFVLTLWNAYSFLVMNVGIAEDKNLLAINTKAPHGSMEPAANLLDKWIVSEFNILVGEVNKQMENYDLVKASRPLREFIDKLSNWYIRRSRKRFTSDDLKDKKYAFQTLYYIMVEYSKLIAPFMPFLAEEIYRNLTGRKSVHLEKYPKANNKLIDKKTSDEMNFVRDVVTLGLAIRAKNSIKVRIPLSKLQITNYKLQITEELLDLIKNELNVKEVEFVGEIKEENGWAVEENAGVKIALNLNITDKLKSEGFAREIVRHIQVMRKEVKYNRDDIIFVKYNFIGKNEDIKKVFDVWGDYIKKECLAKEIIFSQKFDKNSFDLAKELKLGKFIIEIGIKKLVLKK